MQKFRDLKRGRPLPFYLLHRVYLELSPKMLDVNYFDDDVLIISSFVTQYIPIYILYSFVMAI